ncbi:hypothetical protein TVAG_221780 [Trichomonas vaginalis G3]|uniref:Uncharacterized protein n=1 Tax=Trichomonas vaginalis (strain ATCC PRA-98 / G3) TaxID=412133 RepID=A2E3D4_TRIV3|nr:armadillo (ARM) repeat-containing protein family [Trichomonas vaginalis G3]EAY12825.1 hypothetical protein TVAG_221780 [Trichomonas vaginalis G3]KAI5488517.1 armadillo (ARM) repeat-containing protein family [Trichomonas vaginalis G3]|eukprot:XP_001325048.1 hypothetical protein [Trichomonas vaginalis G3]
MDYKESDTEKQNKLDSDPDDKTDSDMHDFKYYKDLFSNYIEDSDQNRYINALDAIIHLVNSNVDEAMDIIFEIEIIRIILEHFTFEFPDIVIKSLLVFNEIASNEKYSQQLWVQDFFTYIAQWFEITNDLYIYSLIFDLISTLIKKSKQNYCMLLNTTFVAVFGTKLNQIPPPTEATKHLHDFYISLYQFYKYLYRYKKIRLPDPYFRDIPTVLFAILPFAPLELVAYILNPMMTMIEKHRATLGYLFIRPKHFEVLCKLLESMHQFKDENEEFFNFAEEISRELCVILQFIFDTNQDDDVNLSIDDLIDYNLYEILKQSIEIFPSITSQILEIIGDLVALKRIPSPEIPMYFISLADSNLNIDQKTSFAFLFFACAQNLGSQFCEFVYENLDMIDGILEILYTQEKNCVYNIMNGIIYLVDTATKLGFDLEIFQNKLEEQDITDDFIDNTQEMYDEDDDIYETCERFLKMYETGDASIDDEFDENDIPAEGFVFSINDSK